MVTTQALANVFDHFDRELLTPYAVGFDRVFDRLHDHYALHQRNTGFPPYNIRKDGESKFVIELALAGLSQEDLEVEVADGTLTVRNKEKKAEEDGELLHRGISYRQFSRSWTLADDVVVNSAKMENGMLMIDLERVIPDEKKPRLVKIG
jgi:molecular chaperone IbpA|tara:strand:- start:9 stop:458 length:450 start_codon:yes stop_codon:yes gene_type:complete